MIHAHFMRRSLALAEKGRGKAGINPMVGAVLVRDGVIIAEGHHSAFGSAHAERELLQNFDPTSPTGLRGARQKIDSCDTLYVNLEPCCHTGKTPPCVDLIIEKGIKNVVYGMQDPNPKVAGKGIEYLIKKGVQVLGPVLEQECMRLNRGFISVMTKNRPWITLHEARTVDGRHAKPDGSPLKITSPAQDAWSHEYLRARHDAILVGVGTVIADDPMLTVRPHPPSPSPQCGEGVARAERGSGERTSVRGLYKQVNPYRIILDPSLKIPLTAKVVGPSTIVIAAPGADATKKQALEKKGVRIFEVPHENDHFDWASLWSALTTPLDGFHGISSILVEGGPRTWEVFRQSGVVNEEVTLLG